MINEKSKFVICYHTPAGEQRFAYADAKYTSDGKVDLDSIKADFPDMYVTNIFETSDDLLNCEALEQSEFEKVCRNYDFEPTDYRRLIIHPVTKQKWLLVGFEARRRKYKVRLFNPQTHRYILSTLNAVRQCMV